MTTPISSNTYLSMSDMTINAQYILDALQAQGWTKQSVCGMLGNMQTESTINPGVWEGLIVGRMDKGYGLVQWTPSSDFFTWCTQQNLTPSAMDTQIKKIEYELAHGEQWQTTSTYSMTFTEFTKSTQSAQDLCKVFMWNYERAQTLDQPQRWEQAQYWYDNLNGSSPTPPPPPTTKKHKMPIYMYNLLW